MKKTNYIIIAGLLVLVAVGSFFAGTRYQKSKTPNFQQMAERRLGQRGERAGLTPVRGKIIKLDESSIVVELPDKSSKIVLLTENTVINKTEKGSLEDLAEGGEVSVFGQANSDGSLTAQNIQLNPRTYTP